MSVEINGGNVGLTVSVKFDTNEAVNNLIQALDNVGTFDIKLNTEQITKAAAELQKVAQTKLNLEGQQESLQYFTNVTKELEKQVQASERIRNNMQTAGAKALIKQHNSEQKDLYTESQKLMNSIVKSEQQLLILTGKEKQQLKGIIKDKKSQLNALGEQITHEHYSELYAQKRKEMESAITEQKIKQREITKQLRATEKEQTADNKNAERLVNAEKTYKRIVEVKTQLYKLTKDDPAVPTLKEELYNLNQLIRGYKSAKDTKAELQKMSEAADLKYRQNIGLIDSQALQTQQKELKKLQETEKTEIKRYIDSLGTQIKDIYKTLYSTTDENSQTALSKRLTQLNEELNIYREMAEWKKTVAKLDREIDTTKTTSLAKAMDAQTKANEARENGINKAWSGEYYSQYNKNLNESKTLEKQIREELVKTTGVKADSIKLEEQELEALKQKGGYIAALATNLMKVRSNIQLYEDLTRPADYNNVVKDFSIEEKQAQIEREKLSHTEKLLENQLKEARLVEEVIPLQQRLLAIQLERLSNNKYLTQEQRQELTTVQEMITALNGKTKAEVTANAQMIKNELSYQNQLATLNKENLSLEETIKLESKLATYQKNKVLRAIEDLETGKLAAHVDKERLETIRQMANSLDGADKSIIQSLSKTMTDGLSGVKHDANVSARIEKNYANEQSLANYISAQKDVLKNQATTLANEKLQGFILKENYQSILKQIDALDGANKEEVKNQASLINKNIELEKSTALRSQELAQVQANVSQSVEAYYLEQESANKKAQLTAQSMTDKINELKAGKELTVEQQKQVANLEEMQRLMASNQILSMEQYTTLNDQFNAQLKHYNSELKQESQIQAAKEELELTKQNLALNKQKLENRLKELEVSKNAKYLDQQQLATAKEMVATLTGSNTKELTQNTRLASSYIDNMVSNANVNRMRKLGDGAHSLGQSFKNLAGYISGAMIIRHFWQEMKNGLTVVKEVDSALTTLRITMTNFSEQDLSNLMSASKDLAVTLKTSFTDVLEVVKTVANETETMETIMAKSKPALILSNLTGLATSETVEMVQGVTKQFSKQFEEMGLSAEESAMKVADSMVAVSRALGMDFSTGISGMAEGIEIMGALASELKMSLEETIALMSSTAEQTRLTFSEIANAMKTTMARTIRISGTDEQISPEDLAKTEKALNGVNIKVRNTLTGEVRPFMDIMQDLAKIWDNLNDSQRGAIGDAMGGARQISTVMAAINVSERTEELTKIAENSVGAAQMAQDTWSQSLEAKLQELSNAGAMFWQTFIDSESFHGFIESLTIIVNKATEIVEAFGSIQTTAATASIYFLALNKSGRTAMTSLTQSIMGYVQARKVQIEADKQGAIATTVATSKTVAQTAATNTATKATVGLKLSTIALQSVLTLGLSAAITFIVTAFTKLSSSAKDTTKAMVDMANKTQETYDDLRSSLETNADGKALIKQYEELTDQVATLKKELDNNSLSAEDLDVKTGELSAAQNDLLTIQEKLIEMYPQASKSIDDQGKLIFGQIQDYKDLTKAEEEHYKQKLQYLAMEASVNKSNVEAQIKENKEKLEKLQWKFSEHQNSQDQYEYGTSWHKEFGAMAAEVAKEMEALSDDTFELEQLLDTYDAVIKQANDSQYELIVSTNKLTDAQDDLSNSTDDLSDSQKNTKKSAEELAAENKEAAETYLEVTENIQKVQEWLEKIESGKFDFSDAQSMLGVLDGFTGDITNIDDVYANLKNQLQDLVQAQGEAYAEMRYQDEEFWSQKYKGSDDWVNYVAAAEQDIISIVSNSLGVQGQDFINYIDDMGGFRDVDLSNVKNLAEAKGAVEGSLVEQLKQMWAEYYKAQSAIISDAVRQDVLKNSPNASIGKVMAMEQEAMAELNKQNEIITNLLNNVNTNVKPTYSGGAGQTYLNRNPSSSSSSSSSKSNEVADLDLQIDRYHDLEREITRVNNALTANKAAQQHATPTEKVKLMREELKLYQELQKAQSNLMTEQKKELAELRKTLTQNGFTFNSDGTISNYQRHLQQLQNAANSLAGDAKTNKIEAVKGIKEIADAYEQLINETIPSTQNAYEELTNTIRETQKQQLQYIADIQSQITDALTEELQKRNDAVKSALEKEKELYNKQYDEDNWNDEFNQEKQKLAEIQAQIDALSRDFSEAGRLKLEQLMEEYREQQEAIDKMLQDKMHEEGNSRYDEAIEELDKELEDLLTPESLASMVSEALEKGFISLNGEVIKTENLLTEMLKNSGDLFLATGQLIQSELIDGLKVAQSLMSDIAKLNSSYLGSARSMTMDTSTYTLTPNVNTRSIDTRGMATSTPSVTVSFDQLLNVEGNLDTSLMLDLETKLRQAMDEVTRSISQALTYR